MLRRQVSAALRAAPAVYDPLRRLRFSAWRAHVALTTPPCAAGSDAPPELYLDPSRIIDQAEPGGPADQVAVTIGRHGDLYLHQGAAVLQRARSQGIDRISVRVARRHSAWRRFRREILAYAAAHGGRTYQPLLHPDLQDIPAGHGERRFDLIRAHVTDAGSPLLLDVGAHWGYFCHRFEDAGFRCVAVESDPGAVYFMRRLRRAERKQFSIAQGDVLDLSFEQPFGVVLALNIFHHFLKTAEDYTRLVAFLQRLRTRLLVFEPHVAEEPQMHGAYRNYRPEEFVAFVAQHTGLHCTEYLGQAEVGRSVYLLRRPA